MSSSDELSLLCLLQLADSALPIGTVSHSFGIESLVEEARLGPDDIATLMHGLLEEPLLMEAAFCRAGYGCGENPRASGELNELLSARKPARETRAASFALGRRFVQLVSACAPALCAVFPTYEMHFAVAFGVACSALGIAEDSCILAFLEQSCATTLSALMRLLPLGQAAAGAILWDLKAQIVETCRASHDLDPHQVFCFSPALEIASMRHPLMETRLFVS